MEEPIGVHDKIGSDLRAKLAASSCHLQPGPAPVILAPVSYTHLTLPTIYSV